MLGWQKIRNMYSKSKDIGESPMFNENIIDDESYFFTIYQENLISTYLMEIARIFQNIIVKP